MKRQLEASVGLVALVLVVSVGSGAASALGSAAGGFLLDATPEQLRARLVGAGVGITLLGAAIGYTVWRIAQSLSWGERHPGGDIGGSPTRV